MSTDTTLRTVERALKTLEIIAASTQPPLVREVADRLGHNVTSAYHIVNTLIKRGYLMKDPTGRLSIGRKIGILNASYLQSTDRAEIIRPLIADLAKTSGETVYLTRFMAESSVIEMVVESQHSLRVTGLNVGYSGAEDRRASGKAVLSQLSADELKRVFRRLHPEIRGASFHQALDELDHELGAIREKGYAFDDEEFEVGICCIAAPYFDADGRVGGAVAASAPATRMELLRESIRDQVLATTARITQLISDSHRA